MAIFSFSDAYKTGKQAFKDVVSTGGQIVKYVRPKSTSRKPVGYKKTVNRVKPPNLNLYVNRHGMLTERKFLDVTSAAIAADTTCSFQLLNGIAVQTGPSDRIGNIIQPRSLSLRLKIISPTAFTVAKVRVLIVLDRQPNGAIFQASDLLADSTQPAESFYGLVNRGRFQVLKDLQVMSLPVDSATVGTIFRNFGLNLRGLTTIYKSSGNGIADISTNSIYAVVCSTASNGGAANLKPTVSFYARLRYYDQ